MRPPALHVLQTVRYSETTRAGTVAAGALRCDGDRLVGAAGEQATFDGIFGAFFDGYWVRHTGVRDLVLSFRLSGEVEVVVERIASSDGGRERIVRSRLRGAGEWVAVVVPLGGGGETRLALTLTLIADSEIAACAWATPSPPARAVGLAAVICTFNRDDDVAATLGELLADEIGLARVLVVNQGRPGLADRIAHVGSGPHASLLTVIDQGNLGGAGGFGRGMLESLSDERCTHVLLMDDDIELDRDSVSRLIAVASYLTADHAIGGAMLDRRDRRTLFSVGDVLHATKPEIRNLVDPAASDITTEAASRYLARHHRPDFNGWWFFAFPKAVIGNVGMPLPLFIRGDDVEYGYRLTLAGVRTLAWPGLAVWHEPFHTKRHPWHYFYDRRNSLYLCEMHGRFGRLRLASNLATGFLNHLLRYDYDRATCIMLGLKAFNDGAATLADWDGEDHARLATTFASHEVPAAADEGSPSAPTSHIPMPMLFLARLVHDLTRTAPVADGPTVLASSAWRPAIRRRPRHVRVHYADSRTTADFVLDGRRARLCGRRFATELLRFLVRRWRPDRVRRLTRPDFWSSYTTPLTPNSRRT